MEDLFWLLVPSNVPSPPRRPNWAGLDTGLGENGQEQLPLLHPISHLYTHCTKKHRLLYLTMTLCQRHYISNQNFSVLRPMNYLLSAFSGLGAVRALGSCPDSRG